MTARQVLEQSGMPPVHQMETIVGSYVNSGISINYVSGWGLKEALRELIQNAVDGMISYMKSVDTNVTKSEWLPCMHETYSSLGTYRTFTFTWPQRGMVVGKILYDPDTQVVTLENPGTINKFNLLLGGSGSNKREDDPDIIGRFGEGMKLAALALLRPSQKPYLQHLPTHTRSLTIDTGGHRWLFKLQPDSNFDDEICLFYKIRSMTNRESQRCTQYWTYTRIQGVTFEEWKESYKNFIFFCKPEEVMEIPTIGNVTHKGSLLLSREGENMGGRFFVKDLHIHDYGTCDYDEKSQEQTIHNFKHCDPAGSYYGYNTNEVELNRDRKSIPNLWHKYERSSCIMADVLNNMQRNLNTHQDAQDLLHEMWQIVYLLLRLGRYEVYYFANYASTATCDRIWREWIKDRYFFPANENTNNMIMPMYTSHQVSVVRFFQTNHLEQSFYDYRVLSNLLCAVLYKTTYYQSWSARFQALMDSCQDSVLNEEQQAVKTRLVNKMQRLRDTFTAEMIHFKDPPLQSKTSYLRNNQLYLAKELLGNENQLLLKCLQLMKIPSSRLLEFCNL